MSVTVSIIFCFYVGYGQAQTEPSRTPLPFPHLIDFNESDIGKPYLTFDGVDYSLIPTEVYHRDFEICNEEYARCTRFMPYLSPVCGYFRYHNDVWQFYSICELDYRSCLDMKRRGIPMHGTNYRHRGVYLIGEGGGCQMEGRRIMEGKEPPRDIRDAPRNEYERRIAMKYSYGAVTRATDFQYQTTMKNSDYDYENFE